MKTMAKLLSAATVLTGAAMMPAAAQADVSYNVGFASEYYYRGYFQKSSSASAGIDFEVQVLVGKCNSPLLGTTSTYLRVRFDI
jgi:spermidine/putrescine-binding protein